MIHISIVLPAPTALAGTMTVTETIMIDMVALMKAEAGEMNGAGLGITTGAVLRARSAWGLVR